MRPLRRLVAWRVPLRSLLRRRGVEREMDAELPFHVEQLVAEKVAQGMPPPQARREAALAFGGIEQVKDGHTCSAAIRHQLAGLDQ